MLSLSVVVPVKNAAPRLRRLLAQLATLADELVVLIDSASSDDSEAISRSFTQSVYRVEFDPQFLEIHVQLIERCSGDWILMIDDDEILSPAWSRDILQCLMSQRRITHYWIPRRWLVDGGRHFLCNSPWYPDFQLRLVRNIPSIIEPPAEMHSTFAVAGEASYLTDLHIYHLNLMVNSRAEREEKVRRSLRANPARSCREYYLPEEYYHQARPFADTPAPKHINRTMGDLTSSLYCVDTFVCDVPEKLVAGQTYAIKVQVDNRSGRALKPQLPYASPRNFSLSHHLYKGSRDKQEIHEYGASRFPLATMIPIGGTQRALVDVRMPVEPGEYLLAFDVVEEFKAWFSEADPSGYRELRRIIVSRE